MLSPNARDEPVLDPAREEGARLGRRGLRIDVLGDDRADFLERPPVADRGERGTLERIDRGVEHVEVVPPHTGRRRPCLGLGRRGRPDLVHRPRALDDVEGGDHLQAEIFPAYRVALLHGRMKSDAKERVMHAFAAGQIHILVSTTVVEVGVDVPNASVMVVEHAERFGLSQLHQLRGRVGRGPWESHCILLYQSPWTDEARGGRGAVPTTKNSD